MGPYCHYSIVCVNQTRRIQILTSVSRYVTQSSKPDAIGYASRDDAIGYASRTGMRDARYHIRVTLCPELINLTFSKKNCFNTRIRQFLNNAIMKKYLYRIRGL